MADIWLQRSSTDIPWGFRISGGRDYQEPIRVARVTAGSIASTRLTNGDTLLKIFDTNASYLTQAQANEIIKSSGTVLQLVVAKADDISPPTVDGTMADPGQYSTRLNEQLSSMNIDNYGDRQPSTPYSPYTASPSQPKPTTPHSPYTPNYPPPPTPQSPYTPSTPRGYQSPAMPQHNAGYNSPTVAASGSSGYHPLANAVAPPAPPPPPSDTGNSYSSTGRPSRPAARAPEKPAVPDAVLNMASKGQPDKKPFAYAADMNEIKEHREKVRRKPVGIPNYQNILNLPQFDDKPIARPYNPAAPGQSVSQRTPTAVEPGPGEGVYQHSQYNTPLGLYSAENAEEVFKGQTDGVVTNVAGLPGTKETKDITESETYKMIHGINNPKSRPKIVVPAHTYQGRQPKEPAPDDEMTFSGVNRPYEIPSKSFHRLQSLTDTGGSEVDTTSIRPKEHLGDEQVGGYDEASIRYLGKNIPSKSFRMLQDMTGGADQPVQATPRRRQQRRREEIQPQPQQNEKHDDEIVDISYVGGNIPSRTFKILQQSIGEPHANSNEPEGGSAVKVQPVSRPEQLENKPTQQQDGLADNNRRQRRRQRNREMSDSKTPERQFDENDYLSGNVQIVSGSVNAPRPQRPRTQMSIDLSKSSQPSQEEESSNRPEFDEQAFLTGRVPIISGESKPWSPKKKDFREKAPWEREEEVERPAEIFQDEPFRRKGKVERERAPWEQDREDYPQRENLTNLSYKKEPERERAPWERSDDEQSGRENLINLNFRKEVEKEKAPWEVQHRERNFDEDQFRNRRNTEPNQPVEDASIVTNGNSVPFDEGSFLKGKIPLVSGSEDGSTKFHSSTQYKKPTAFRERAPWERPDSDQEGGGFDEKEFLMGRVPLVSQTENNNIQGKGKFNKIPSKAFLRLTRSMSREASPSQDTTSDYLSADDDDRSDPGLSTSDPRYVGNKIPSKTFLKLHRSMERRSAEPEREDYPYDDYRQQSYEDHVSKQVEDVTIENKEPEVYFKNLKDSLQETEVKMEPQAEATDF